MTRVEKTVVVLELTNHTVEEYQQIEDAIVELEYRGFDFPASLHWRID